MDNKNVKDESQEICKCNHPASEHASVGKFCEHMQCGCKKYRPKYTPNPQLYEDLL